MIFINLQQNNKIALGSVNQSKKKKKQDKIKIKIKKEL